MQVISRSQDFVFQTDLKMQRKRINNTRFLAYLCSRVSESGTLDDVKDFIKKVNKTGKEMQLLLNKTHDEFNGGTLLHVVFYWNYGELGFELFELLVEHGAEYKLDAYGQYPWQQKNMFMDEKTCEKIRKIYKL